MADAAAAARARVLASKEASAQQLSAVIHSDCTGIAYRYKQLLADNNEQGPATARQVLQWAGHNPASTPNAQATNLLDVLDAVTVPAAGWLPRSPGGGTRTTRR